MSSQVVVITGGSSGIGLATAMCYAARGADLVLVARGQTLLAEAATACRDNGARSVRPVVADVRDESAIEAMMTSAVAEFGRVDVVVHAAMVMAYGTIEELSLEIVDRVVDTATHGTVRVARAALRVFRAQQCGSLVIVTSLLASVAVPGIGSYVTGKWAQLGLARVLKLETADAPDIIVTTVSPGAVDTPIYRRAASVVGHHGKPPAPVDRADKVARGIVRAVDHRRTRVSVGLTNHVVVFGFRFTNRLYERLVGPLYQHFALDSASIAATDGNVLTHSSPDVVTVDPIRNLEPMTGG
jgi:NAD(P)-dependent dehydrogenase (short-subunit alcohol dehydrogenase family)